MKNKLHGVPMLVLAAAISDATYGAVQAVDDNVTVRGGAQNVVIDVLANDIATSNGLQIGSEFSSTSDQGGAVSLVNNTFIYTPPSGFAGVDTFAYSSFDDEGSSYGGTATVTIVVLESSTGTGGGPIESTVTGESNKETAAMLDEFCTNPSDDLRTACAELDALVQSDPEALNELVSQITPDEILMQRRMISETLRSQTGRLYSSQQLLRSGGGVGTIGSNTLLMNSYLGGTAGSEAQKWALFGSVKFGETDHDQTSRESAYEADMTGVMVGLNYRLRPDLDVGAAIDLVQYDVEYATDAGELDSSVYTLSGYGSWVRDQIGVDVMAGYSSGDIATQRTILNTNTLALDTVEGDTDSTLYYLSTQVQYTYNNGALTARPYGRIDYLSSEVDGYAETGANPWLMQVGKQELNQVNLSVGVDTTYAFSFDWGVMVPGIVVSVISEESKDYAPVAFSLVNDSSNSSSFELKPDSEDSLFYQFDVNSVFVLKNGLSTFLSAQFIAGYDNLSSYQVQCGLNYEL